MTITKERIGFNGSAAVKSKRSPSDRRERLNNYVCPMLLGGTVCFTVIYALYRPLAPLYTAVFALCQYLLFAFFDRLKTRKLLGGLIYTLILMVIWFFTTMMSFSGGMGMMLWFYGQDGSYSMQPMYLNAVFIGGGFFLISILYYFTQIRYRSLGVMLCILFPFVIYAKRADDMPEILATLIITAYLAVMVHNRRIDPAIAKEKRGKLVANRAYIVSIAVFVSVAGAVAMVIEKPSYRSQLERSSDYFDLEQTEATGGEDYSNITDISSSRQGGVSYTNTPLFYLDADNKQYEYFLRRQSYDIFNGDVWETGNKLKNDTTVYSSENPEYSTDDIIADMAALSSESRISAPSAENIYKEKRARVFDESFTSAYLPAPLGTITDDKAENKLEYLKYPQSLILRANAERASALNDSFTYNEIQNDAYEYAYELGLSSEEYIEMLDKFAEAYPQAQRLKNDYLTSKENYLDMSNISGEVKDLAQEITAGSHSDIEKATAIESYFGNAGFVYSLEYVPEDGSIDYFIFESKTGYCTSFATAMTIMARSVGLPARYVEGYAAYERTDEGSIVVRDGHAHAFVEVYIPGTGWLTFDPTVSDYRASAADENGGFNFSMIFGFISRFLVVIAVVFSLVFISMFDRFKQALFRVRLRFMPVKQKTLMLYADLIKVINRSTGGDFSPYTAGMLTAYLEESREVVPNKLITLFERTAFGGYEPTKAEFDSAYEQYKRCYKYLRRVPGAKELVKIKNSKNRKLPLYIQADL